MSFFVAFLENMNFMQKKEPDIIETMAMFKCFNIVGGNIFCDILNHIWIPTY